MCEMCDFGLWTWCAGVNELNTITSVEIKFTCKKNMNKKTKNKQKFFITTC